MTSVDLADHVAMELDRHDVADAALDVRLRPTRLLRLVWIASRILRTCVSFGLTACSIRTRYVLRLSMGYS